MALAVQNGLPWWSPFAAAVVCLFLAFMIATLVFGKRTILGFGRVKELLKWDDCKRCTGGTQWWNGKRWGPIPESARIVQEGSPQFHPPQANIRSCMYCGMKGGWWRPKLPQNEDQQSRTNAPSIDPTPEEKTWWQPSGDEDD